MVSRFMASAPRRKNSVKLHKSSNIAVPRVRGLTYADIISLVL